MGEKFAANPVTGTGSMSVPIVISPGRAGFGPQLSLSYDSGSGNGPFGFGWSLSLPAIVRKTDKGLPQYRDAEESDVFILSGSEDLVPVLQPDGTRFENGHMVRRYLPRIEGLFARIERWTNTITGESHWRSISRDNVTTLYGKDNKSRIFDPSDPSPANPTRVFSWLICASYDDKGNAIVYEYAEENADNVDLGQVNERHRLRTADRYLKRIKYGNRVSRLIEPDLTKAAWMFEVIFDYDEAHYKEVNPRPPPDRHLSVRCSGAAGGSWAARSDPFSSHRAGFEVRTYRRCHRVLMFHHVPDLPTGEKGCDGLVGSTEFDYADLDHRQPLAIEDELAHHGSTRFAAFLRTVRQSGYVRDETQAVVVHNGVTYATYLKKSLPPLTFEYSKATIQDDVLELDAESLENLPTGVNGSTYRWVDLDGEGVSGILTEQAGAWFYKPSLGSGRFGPMEAVSAKPSVAALSGGRQQLLDLAGDGQLDLVELSGPTPGFYERTFDEDWAPFRTLRQLPNIDWDNPNLRFVDLDGDGHADVLITEQDVFTWHGSLAEEGFGPARRVYQPSEEERGPRLVLADGTQSIYVADMCGDGLTDLVRVRNGEVCYWPNQGYGRFGAKVTMDNAPYLDHPDQFDQRRVRLADINGSGTSDMIYLHRDGVRLYFNQSGNRLSEGRRLKYFPRVDDVSSVMAADLLGHGTACLIWSSALPADARRPLRYIDLMGGQKPHLLVTTLNNLGAETRVRYAPSTKFYLQDKRDGTPWITRLPFPVHVVERVETYDHVSRNRFVTRYAYHHGYFDGVEREFRGFGMVEQWDTEELAALEADGLLDGAENLDAACHVPPVHSKTWFHTGIFVGRERVSRHFEDEYFRELGLTVDTARPLLLDDTIVPPDLTPEEEREACRALKGSMLRQEVYADDGEHSGATPEQVQRARTPYTVTEQNFTVRPVQSRAENRHAVFFTHPREAISYHYERNPGDPRIQHALTLEVDEYGNVLKEAAIGYGRRQPDAGLPLQADRDKQTRTLITYTENRVTNPIADVVAHRNDYRSPLPCETRTYELTGFKPEPDGARFTFDHWKSHGFALPVMAAEISYELTADNVSMQKRLIEHVRTLYRKDDLTAFLPLGEVEPMALPGESYKLAFTPGLLAQIFQQDGQPLLPDPAAVLGGQGADRGGYVVSQDVKATGHFPGTDPDDHWWLPAGRVFLSPGSDDTAAQELTFARQHFFLPHRTRDPFHTNTVSTESVVTYDVHDLLMLETRDVLGNRVTVGERLLPNGDLDPNKPGNDYRLLKPQRVMDPNRNRTQVAFDILGMVVGTAVMGAPEENLGDSLDGFIADLTEDVTLDHLANPLADPHAILGRATTRLVYDLFAYQRSKDLPDLQPAVVYSLARETHDADLQSGEQTKLQHSFSYSDGFGREIQKKIQAEPEKVNGVAGPPRWVGSGWTIFNNKGKPVRQYEPFFSATHRFEFGVQVGVSPILFYDPAERVVATLHPNHSYEKVVFDPWRQTTFDVNDTVLGDPRTDTDIQGYTTGYFESLPVSPPAPQWQTWHAQRQSGILGMQEQAAAGKAAAHADTPTMVYSDALGRPFLTVAHNRVISPDHDLNDTEDHFHTRIELDIEGNERAVRDAIQESRDQQGNPVVDERGRIVMRYDYDMLGNRIHQLSMEAGVRWMLNDVAGNPIRAWDSRGHSFRTGYDPLRRPLRTFVAGTDSNNPNQELLTDRMLYGEQHPEAGLRNLRGTLYLQLDQAGAVTAEAHDFKGNPLRASRRIATEYKQAIDWSTVDAELPASAAAAFVPATLEAALAPRLETDIYTSRTTYDALNRPVTLTTPHAPTMQPSIIRPGYNEANLLERMDVNLHRATAAGRPVWTPFVTNIDYDAKGQRTLIDYRTKGATVIRTTYGYDRDTFRLTHLYTRRGVNPTTAQGVAFTDDCDNPNPPPPSTIAAPEDPPAGKACGLQNLHYTYDPAGNITHIRDDAQQTIYFKNKRVEPSADYTYDAIYRLIEATGREHLGQIGGAPIPHSHNDAGRVGMQSGNVPGQFGPNDDTAMGTYIERYVYDAVGNFLAMQHRGSDPAHAGWTRSFAYNETSLIEDGTGASLLKTSNRLTSTTVGNGNPITEIYSTGGDGYDPHGSMQRMPHLSLMQWDYRDQLQATARQVVNNGGEQETTWYVYDAAGQRVRKVTERQAPAGETPKRKQERLYLGGFEIYRDYNTDGSVKLVRETLHVMDDSQRIALVETRTDTPTPEQLVRYQLGNHLGSASLELDRDAQIISYEEYTPYGSTSYQAGRSQAEVKRKQYRYTGMERDEESGFSYHSARYYLPWLGRWGSVDPAGLVDGPDLYQYASANPVTLLDTEGLEPEGPRADKSLLARLRRLGQSAAFSIAEKAARVWPTPTQPPPPPIGAPIPPPPPPIDDPVGDRDTNNGRHERQESPDEKLKKDIREKNRNRGAATGKGGRGTNNLVKPDRSSAPQNTSQRQRKLNDLRKKLKLPPPRPGPPPTVVPPPPGYKGAFGAAKKVGKNILKQVPLVGDIVSGGIALNKLREGDWKGALREGISAVPFVGTVIDIGEGAWNVGKGVWNRITGSVEPRSVPATEKTEPSSCTRGCMGEIMVWDEFTREPRPPTEEERLLIQGRAP